MVQVDISQLSLEELTKLREEADRRAEELQAGAVKELKKKWQEELRELQKRHKQEVKDLEGEWKAEAKAAGLTLEAVMGGAPKTKKAPLPPKFRNPSDPEQTWSGRGKRPNWFKEALARGISENELLIA